MTHPAILPGLYPPPRPLAPQRERDDWHSARCDLDSALYAVDSIAARDPARAAKIGTAAPLGGIDAKADALAIWKAIDTTEPAAERAARFAAHRERLAPCGHYFNDNTCSHGS